MSSSHMSASHSFTSGLDTHHRKTSSKLRASYGAAASVPPQYTARMGSSDEELTPVKERRGFVFPVGPEVRSTKDERLGAILENGSYGVDEGRGSDTEGSSSKYSPARTRTSPERHRVSPSLPYGPYDSKSLGHPVAGPSSPKPLGPQSSVKIVVLAIRRARWLDLIYFVVFCSCIVVFFGALGGVGYKAPVVVVDSPSLLSPEDLAEPRPPIIMPQKAGQAPLVIKEDPEELAREDAERPVFARGRAAAAVAGAAAAAAAAPAQPAQPAVPPVVQQQQQEQEQQPQHDAPRRIPAPLIMRRPTPAQPLAPHQVQQPVPIVAAAVETPVPEPDDRAPDLVGDSPADQRLDDEHAAHYHHPAAANVFRAQGATTDEGVHHETHADEAEGHKIVPVDLGGSPEQPHDDDEDDGSLEIRPSEHEIEARDIPSLDDDAMPMIELPGEPEVAHPQPHDTDDTAEDP